MHDVHITDRSEPWTIYAAVDWWEYGCCGDVPTVGAAIAGHLTTYAADSRVDRRFLLPQPVDWDREFELVRFAGVAARFDPQHGDPVGQPLQLLLSWHGDDPAPQVTADIAAVYLISERFHRVDRACAPIAGTRQYTRVNTAERHPRPDGDREPVGVMLELAIRSLDEPTRSDLAAHHRKLERAARTLHLTGPAAIFGRRVPAASDHLTVELDDDRFTIDTAARGRASGMAIQVSRAIPCGSYTAICSVEAGTLADEVDEELFVVLLLDR